MHRTLESNMTFRLELFVDDLVASTDFYGRVLGFVIGEQQADGYTPLTNGHVSLSLNLRANLSDDHPIQAIVGERLGRGIELVLEVNDIEAMYKRVRSANWPLSGELKIQPWSLTDFRVLDPDGYYWRITSRGKDGS
jgi:lactoylglutathione lyase